MSEPKLVDRETSARALLEQREQSCSILLLFNHHQQQQQQPSPSPLSIPCCCLVFLIESQQMKERDCTWKGRNRSGNEAKRALCHQHYLHLHGNAQRFPLAMNTLSAKALWLAPTRQPKSALSIFLSICLCLFLSVGRSVSDWSTETHEHLDRERRQQQDPSKTLAGLQFQLQRGREIKLAPFIVIAYYY